MSESRPVIKPIPLSVIMEAAAMYTKSTYPDEPDFSLIDRHYSLGTAAKYNRAIIIPVAFEWGFKSLKAVPAPPEVLAQLVGQKSQAGMIVEYQGKRYLVWTIDFECQSIVEYPKVGSVFTEPPRVDFISLVEAAYVALDK